MTSLTKIFAASALTILAFMPIADAQAPYDPKLLRLAEILGSIQFLRSLCGETNGPWRAQMEALLEAEAPSEERKAKLIASFNHGYRSFAAVYSSCTEAAIEAIDRYMEEGEALSSEIAQRYGN